jgi:hypothetical protein
MSAEREARTLLARLELLSHVPAVSTNESPVHGGGEPKGGNRPRGGIDHRDDVSADAVDFPQKSHVYYRRRFMRCHTEGQFVALVKEMRKTLEAWAKTPEVKGGLEPERGSFRWKRMIANDDETDRKKLGQLHRISQKTIYNYRLKYRTKRDAA